MKLIALFVLIAGQVAVADTLRTYLHDDRTVEAMVHDNPKPAPAATGVWFVDPRVNGRHIQLMAPSTNDQQANLFCQMIGKRSLVTYEGNDRSSTASAITYEMNAMPVTLKDVGMNRVDVTESRSVTQAHFIFSAIECTAN